MAIEDRTRHERLGALLPRVYATDPRDSVLGVLLDALADGLRSFDRDTERALRDKWLATARAAREANDATGLVTLGGTPEPLEHIGSLLDLLRQPWEDDEQGYRRRIALLGSFLARGLATPRSILMFAISSLNAEPCPVLDRGDDGTTAFGFEVGRVARCRTCRGGRELPSGPCPLRAEATMTASLVDNPRVVMRVSRESLEPDASGRATIRFESNSLFPDRPELELTVASSATHVVPSFRSRQSGELVIVLRALQGGQTLSILPRSPYVPSPERHLQEWVDRPPGSSLTSSVVRINGVTTTVPVLVLQGVGFDHARFDVDAFLHAAPDPLEVSTPAVVPGLNTWDYVALGPEELEIALASLPADMAPPEAPDVDGPDLGPVTLRLRWWTRPAAHFSLRIPPTDAVRAAVARGQIEYLRRMIERARPVGVTFLIELPEAPFRDTLADALEPLDTPAAYQTEEPTIGSFDHSTFDFSLWSA